MDKGLGAGCEVGLNMVPKKKVPTPAGNQSLAVQHTVSHFTELS
jgi:hypothetical protein